MNWAFLQTLRTKLILLIVGVVFVVTPLQASAQFNPEINYQGKLTDGSGVAVSDGLYNINFWLVPTSGGATSTAVWSEARTSANRVQVTNGLFSVMLGEVSSLASVDFNQELYLAVEVGGTGTPAWDGELLPRKILGAVPAAFVANYATNAGTASSSLALGGVASSSFLRSDEADTMTASSSSSLLTLVQNGVGKVLSLFSGVTEIFTVLSNGNVGVGTTTPTSTFSVDGNSSFEGNLDVDGTVSINGALQGSLLTAGRALYVTTGGYVVDSADFTYNGIDLGLGGTNGLAFGGTRYLTASTTNDSLIFGENAGATFNDLTIFNNAIGYQAGRYASTTAVDYNNFMGYQAGYNNTSNGSNLFGYRAGYNNSVSNVVAIGYQAMGTTTGSNTSAGTIAIGYQALFNNTSGANNTAVGVGSLSSNTTGGANVAYGNNTLNFNTTGSINSAFGQYALQDNTIGNSNSAFGSDALANNIGGNGNSAFGDNALDANTTGNSNSAFGLGALGGNVDGGSNAAFGHTALNDLTTGNYNTALGYDAGSTQTAGSNNIMIGYNAAVASTTGSNQLSIANVIYGGLLGTTPVVGIGTSSPSARFTVLGHSGSLLDNFRVASSSGTTLFNVTSIGNVGIGTSTPNSKLTIVGDTYITGAIRDGVNASGTLGMVLQTTGTSTRWVATSTLGFTSGASTFLALTDTPSSYTASRIMYTNAGATALIDSADFTYDGTNLGLGGDDSIAFGGIRYLSASTTNDSLIFGENAGATFTSSTLHNVALGFEAGRYASTTNSDTNNFFGYQAGYNNTGANNNLFGYRAGYNNTANTVVAIGYQAMGTTTAGNSGFGNIGIGYQSLFNNTSGSENTAVGSNALSANTSGLGSVAFGTSALASNTTGTNSAFGSSALTTNTTGSANSAFGRYALRYNLSGLGNSSFGSGALEYNVSSSDNSAFGLGALGLNINGESNTAIGAIAGRYLTDGTSAASTTDYSVFLGRETKALTADDQNTIVIGYNANGIGSNTVVLGNDSIVTTALKGNVGIGTTSPSAKLDVWGNVQIGTSSRPLLFANTAARQLSIGTSAVVNAFDEGPALMALSGDANGESGNPIFVINEESSDSFSSGQIQFLRDSIATDRVIGRIFFQSSALIDAWTDVDDSSAGSLRFSTDAPGAGPAMVEQMRLTSAGNLGIGTTTPSSKLTVAGNTYIGGNLNFSNSTSSSAGVITRNGTRFLYDFKPTNGGDFNPASIFLGRNAGNFTMGSSTGAAEHGTENIGIGEEVLSNNVTGAYNTAVGSAALVNNTTGYYNNAFGRYALISNTTGSVNTGLGGGALSQNTTGNENTAVGSGALDSADSSFNTAVGRLAGADITSGGYNTLLGWGTGIGITTGEKNTILGANVSGLSSSLSNNIIIADGDGNQRINVGSTGNVGLGTSTASSRLTVAGDIYATGAFRDSSNAAGTAGYVLQTTGSGTQWVATSSLGFSGGGATTFLALTDTPSSFTANRIMYTNSGATALIDSADFTYDGTDFGLGGDDGIAFGGTRVISASTTVGNYMFGVTAGNSLTTGVDNIGLGNQALLSNTSGSYNIAIGLGSLYANATGSHNIAMGQNALLSNQGGEFNLAFGESALINNLSGSENIAVGRRALEDNTTGSANTAFGIYAMGDNTTGLDNAVYGSYAMRYGTTGSYNSVFGHSALQNVIGNYNVAFGKDAGNSQTAGDNNIFIGFNTSVASTTGSNQLSIGNLIYGTDLGGGSAYVGIGTTTPGSKLTVAGDINLTGSVKIDGINVLRASTTIDGTYVGVEAGASNIDPYNTFTGARAGYASVGGANTFVGSEAGINSDGWHNTFVGMIAGVSNFGERNVIVGLAAGTDNNGDRNVLIGEESGKYSQGSNNNIFGYQAGYNNVSSNSNIFGQTAGYYNRGSNATLIGQGAGYRNEGDNIIALGYQALGTTTASTTGVNNIALGYQSLFNNTSGYDNFAAGSESLLSNTTGYENVAIGKNALSGNISGGNSVAIGAYALSVSNSPFPNTAIGTNALRYNTTGFVNTAVGESALFNNITGDHNTAVGNSSLQLNIDSGSNVALGNSSLASLLTGGGANVAIGRDALASIVDGEGNVAVGGQAGINATSSASYNVLFGFQAAENLTTGSSNIVIGRNIDVPVATGNDQLNIGNLIFGTGLDGQNSTLSSGNIGIGTTTPGSKLTVAGDINLTGGINFDGTRYITASTTNDSIAFGESAGATFTDLTTHNNAIGFEAGRYASSSVSDNNNYIGYQAGYNSIGARNNLIGYQAGYNNNANSVVGLGYQAFGTTTGSNVDAGAVGIGYRALFNNTDGVGNNAVGESALENNTTGNSNNAFGGAALLSNTTGNNNSAFGDYVLRLNTTGNSNSAFGSDALGDNTTGLGNAAFGRATLGNNTTATYNAAFGNYALHYNVSGSDNAAFGSFALNSITDGAYNSALGNLAGTYLNDGVTVASTTDNSVFIGYNTKAFTSNDQNAIVIGYNANGIGSNSVVLGNDSITTTALKGNVGIGTTTPGYKLTVVGDMRLTGAFRDSVNASGTLGMVLQANGTSTLWSATSTLGLYGPTAGSITSAQLLSSLTNETGTGVAVFGTSPTFTTQITAPLVVGGTAASSNITLKSTSGVGTTDYVRVTVGNNGATEALRVITNGNVGIGTTTPNSRLTIAGSAYLTGALRDSTSATGTLGMVLQSNGTSTLWVATSTLGITGGASTFLSLTDTPSSYTANRIMYTNSGATALVDSADFTYDGTDFGLGANNGIAFGGDRVIFASTTQDNYIFGKQAGQGFTTGNTNVGIGTFAIRNVSTGSANNAIGSSALNALETGSNNNVMGFAAGFSLVSGSMNVLMGDHSGSELVQSDGNTFLGGFGGRNVATSSGSVIVGSDAAYGIDGLYEANRFTVIGTGAGYNMQTGADNNILLGYQAADNLTTGASNIVIGYDIDHVSSTTNNALNIGNLIFGTGLDGTGTTLASGNVGIGTSTPSSKLTVEGDIALTNNLNMLTTSGSGAGVVTVNGSRFIHDYTLDKTYGRNQFMGFNAGNFTSGSSTNSDLGINNLGVGDSALSSLTNGSANTAIGPSSLASLTTAYGNTAVGFLSLSQTTSGAGNTAVGESAMLQNTTGAGNSALGSGTLGNNTIGVNNSAFGNQALIANVTGGENTAIGRQALGANVNGGNNTAVGYFALLNASSSNNSALGAYAASDITLGQNNTIIGNYTGIGITTGSYNTIIGASVTGLDSALSNNIIIADGQGNRRINVDNNGLVGIGTTTPSEELTVAGTIQSTALLGGSTNLTTDANGNIIRDPSDARLKENVETLENALDTVLGLRGVRYQWIDKERFGEQFEVGFIAQEVDELVPEVVTKGGEYWSLNSKNLIAVVVEAIKEMWVEITDQKSQIEELEARIQYLESLQQVPATPPANNDNDGGGSGSGTGSGEEPPSEETPPAEGTDGGGETAGEPTPEEEPPAGEPEEEPAAPEPDEPAEEGNSEAEDGG